MKQKEKDWRTQYLPTGYILAERYVICRVSWGGPCVTCYLAYDLQRKELVFVKEHFMQNIAERAEDGAELVFPSAKEQENSQKNLKGFVHETSIQLQLSSNPFFPTVYELFHANNTMYCSMEYLNYNTDLSQYIKMHGKMSENDVVVLMKKICHALLTMHQKEMVHGNVLPDKIWLTDQDGLKLLGSENAVLLKPSRNYWGFMMYYYYSPLEAYGNKERICYATDIYMLGACAYFAVTGDVPIDPFQRCEHPGATMPLDSSLHLSSQFVKILNKCLQLKAENRYQHAKDLLLDLEMLEERKEKSKGVEWKKAFMIWKKRK